MTQFNFCGLPLFALNKAGHVCRSNKIMTTLDLITKDDFEQFKREFFTKFRKLGISPTQDHSAKKWLKSAELRRLLNISAGTLQNLRINGK